MAVQALRSGGTAVGTMIRMIRNPGIVWIAKQADLDFIMFDLEHGTLNLETLADAAASARGAGIDCFVRVPELSKAYVSRVLDCGCTGVMVPMVGSVAQAERLAGWAKFEPIGKRGLGSSGNHTDYANVSAADAAGFMETSNDRILTIAQIETGSAIDDIEAIAAVPGIDALLIGPNDLAISLGVVGDLQNPKLLSAIDKVAAAAERAGKIFGMHGPDALTESFIPKGLRLIMSGLDIGMMLGAMKAINARWKK